MKHCFIIPRIPTALFFIVLLILFSFPSELTLLIFGTLRYPCLSFFYILSGVFFAFTWFLNSSLAAVNQGPVHQILPFHSGPGSLGLSIPKKALSQSLIPWPTLPTNLQNTSFPSLPHPPSRGETYCVNLIFRMPPTNPISSSKV